MRLILLLVTATLSGPAFSAEQGKMGLWERFCINDKIGDACNRAVHSLNNQISELSDKPETSELKQRLQAVSQMRCDLKKQSTCDLKNESLIQAEVDEF